VSGTRKASARMQVTTPDRKTSVNVTSVRNVSGLSMPKSRMKKPSR
jgi:hypothetical protein